VGAFVASTDTAVIIIIVCEFERNNDIERGLFGVQEMGRHDDLWSLFYMVVEFVTGQLLWAVWCTGDGSS